MQMVGKQIRAAVLDLLFENWIFLVQYSNPIRNPNHLTTKQMSVSYHLNTTSGPHSITNFIHPMRRAEKSHVVVFYSRVVVFYTRVVVFNSSVVVVLSTDEEEEEDEEEVEEVAESTQVNKFKVFTDFLLPLAVPFLSAFLRNFFLC